MIFTDPDLYDDRNRFEGGGRLRWRSVQELLAPENSGPTGSSLLDLFKPLENDPKNDVITKPGRFEVVSLLVRNRDDIFARVSNLSASLKARKFSPKSLKEQLARKVGILDAIESFLMAYREDVSSEAFFEKAQTLAKETLAYSLGNDEEREWLTDIFDGVARRIEALIPDVETQARYGRSLLGAKSALEIDAWVEGNRAAMSGALDAAQMVDVLWPLLSRLAPEQRLRDTTPVDSLKQLAQGWIEGRSFRDLLDQLDAAGARYPHGKQERKFTIDMVVDLCEQTFGFEFSLLLAAVAEAFSQGVATEDERLDFDERIGLFQKRLKYGLPSVGAIAFFEMGFAERIVAQELDWLDKLGTVNSTTKARRFLSDVKEEELAALLGRYPSYFQSVYDSSASVA